MESINNNEDLLNYYNFNEDGSCISIGTNIGFKIVICNPFNNCHYTKYGRGIGIMEMYHSSNILLLTGNENNSKFPSNQLIIWDDNKKEIIREIRISSKIRIIKVIQNTLFIVNDIKLDILNFDNLSLIDSFELYSNEKEYISFSIYKNKTKIAYISKDYKEIYIKNIEKNNKIIIKIKDNDLKFIYLQFNSKGDIILGACKGKVYLYNSSKGELIREIKNDKLDNNINGICFSQNDKFLGISTIEKNLGNIYIFDIGTKKETSIFDYFDYFKEEDKYFAYYEITCKEFLFRFYNDEIIIIVTNNGNFIKIKIDKENGGKCQEFQFKQIFN